MGVCGCTLVEATKEELYTLGVDTSMTALIVMKLPELHGHGETLSISPLEDRMSTANGMVLAKVKKQTSAYCVVNGIENSLQSHCASA